jgi:hypothetical protein
MSVKQVTKSKIKFARYGPSDHYEESPAAGMCISVFALVRRAGKKGVLIGQPKQDSRWASEWLGSWKNYSEKEIVEAYNQWRLPSSYLREGEHPEESIRRIMTDQLEMSDYSISEKGPKIFSYNSPSDWYPGNNHWDFAIVYDVKVKGKDQTKETPKAWQEVLFAKKRKDFRHKDFGWNQDFMQDLGLIEDEDKKSSKK